MTLRYICCRCDTRAESSVGHHLCEAPTDDDLWARVQDGVNESDALGRWQYVRGLEFAIPALGREALSRGYRWALSSVGDGTEYRATFERHLGSPAPSAIDRTPARAFARAWLRTIEAAQRAAEDAA